jgi:hypothetical protein
VVRAKFVDRAARHTHFFLDGSRYGVELMRYSECAYAGCAPLGEVPSSLEAFAPAEFLRSRGSVRDLWRAVLTPLEETARAADAWRAAMRSARDPARLDAALEAQIGGIA